MKIVRGMIVKRILRVRKSWGGLLEVDFDGAGRSYLVLLTVNFGYVDISPWMFVARALRCLGGKVLFRAASVRVRRESSVLSE